MNTPNVNRCMSCSHMEWRHDKSTQPVVQASLNATVGICRAFIGFALAVLMLFGMIAESHGQVSSESPSRATSRSAGGAVSPLSGTLRNAGPTLRTPTKLAPDGSRAGGDASPVPSGKPIGTTGPSQFDNLASGPNTMEGLNDKRSLMIGDKISLSIIEDEMPRHSLVVTDSGEVDVPYVGRVSASGMTCKQLAFHIKRLLEREYYYQATVIVGLDSGGRATVSRGKIYVQGQVRSPGPQEIPADEAYTVGTAILRAGGFAQYANKRKVKLLRAAGAKGNATVIVDLVEVLDKGNRQGDVEVGPGDVITVPEKILNF